MVQDETLEEDDKYYELSPTPIKEKSMLGRHGQQLCNNLDVHWLIQSCHTDGNSTCKCITFSSVCACIYQ